MVQAGLYARISNAELQEGYSIQAQLDALRAHAAGQAWIVVVEYVDPGHSGRDGDRPAFRQLLADAEAGLLEVIAVHKQPTSISAWRQRSGGKRLTWTMTGSEMPIVGCLARAVLSNSRLDMHSRNRHMRTGTTTEKNLHDERRRWNRMTQQIIASTS